MSTARIFSGTPVLAGCLLAGVFSAGCQKANEPPRDAKATIQLRMGGKPLTNTSVGLFSTDYGNVAFGSTNTGGDWQIAEALPIGEYRVYLVPSRGLQARRVPPACLNETATPLRAVLQPGENEIQVDIPSVP